DILRSLHAKGEDFFRFVFVRNPVDRLVSCYLDRVLSPGSVPHRVVKRALGVEGPQDIKFADFVAVVADQSVREMNPHWRPVYNEACCASVTYDAVLKFENLQAELRTLLERLFPQIADSIDLARNLSPAKTRAKERAADFITPELKTKIEAIYAKDYEAFGY
ncbi:MAG: sulfotransferase family 2 domain-containing protein, partial [Pseudomonadota bacterium]